MITNPGNRFSLLILGIFLVLCGPSIFADETRNDFLVLYGEAGAVKDTLIAQRYAVSIEGRPSDMNIIRNINSDFKWFYYISIQDMPSSESNDDRRNYFDNLAAIDGINPETFHVHYWDYTEIMMAGSTLVFPGLQNAITHEDTVNSRVITYSKYRNRFLANLSSPHLRQYEKMYACEVISTIPYEQGVTSTVGYYDGIYWDNGSYCLYNTGSIVTGGQLAEHPTHANKNDAGCSGDNWWWDSGLKLFYQEIKDTFALAPSWAPGGKMKYSMPNNSNSWTDDYATADAGDFFFMEFFPYWMTRASYVSQLYYRDSLAAANGVSLMYSPSNLLGVSNYEGTRTWTEGQLINLCWFYICKSDLAHIYQSGGGYYHNPATNTSPSSHPEYPDNWEEGVWSGVMDFDIGSALQIKYQIAATGTDGRGYSYTIYSRQYENAKVFFRPRGNYNEHMDNATVVSLSLGGTYQEVLPNGNLSVPTSSIILRNADGKIMVPFASDDTIPPAPINDLRGDIGDNPGTINLIWTQSGDDGLNGTASYNIIKYSVNPITLDNWAQATSVPNPPTPSTPGEMVAFEIQNLVKGQFYYMAVQTYDEAGRGSGIAFTSSYARGIKRPVPLFTEIDSANAAVTVACTSVDSYLSILYEFALDTTNTFPNPTNKSPTQYLSDTLARFDELIEGSLYYWSCRTMDIDQTDSSDWSASVSFSLDGGVTPAILTVANLLSPLEGDTVIQDQFVFSVNYIPQLLEVYFQYDEDNLFGSPIESGPTTVTAGEPTNWQPSNLPDTNGIYYWKASADNTNWTVPVGFYFVDTDLSLEIEETIIPHPFPNPVNLAQVSSVTFTDIPQDAKLNIMTVSGILVKQLTSETGEDIDWNGNNKSGDLVASGVYLWYIEGTSFKGKLIVIR